MTRIGREKIYILLYRNSVNGPCECQLLKLELNCRSLHRDRSVPYGFRAISHDGRVFRTRKGDLSLLLHIQEHAKESRGRSGRSTRARACKKTSNTNVKNASGYSIGILLS